MKEHHMADYMKGGEGMGVPQYMHEGSQGGDGSTTVHVRGGEKIGGVAGEVHVIYSCRFFLMHLT